MSRGGAILYPAIREMLLAEIRGKLNGSNDCPEEVDDVMSQLSIHLQKQ